MLDRIMGARRSNHEIFIPYNSGSPQADLERHTSSLGPIARLDFERHQIAGEVIYAIEGDSMPTSQQDEESRIATLAYALKNLGNSEDSAEFMRCLNAICEEGDAHYRRVVASYYYGEIAGRGAGPVLKEMALIAMQLANLNPVTEESDSESVFALSSKSKPRTFFELEVAEVERMIRGRRKSARFVHDEWTEWLNDLEANGASLKELDDAFAHVEALDQYDEGGAIIVMSAHERTIFCGSVDPELTADDLPEQGRYLAGYLRRAYADGTEIEVIWDEINVQLDANFPIRIELNLPKAYFPTNLTTGRVDLIAVERKPRFTSHANRELQQHTRLVLDAIFEDCCRDFHLIALRNNLAYRRFHKDVREARDTGIIGEAMKKAFEAKEAGELTLKHFTALKMASALQRERLEQAPLSQDARRLIREVETASSAKLRYLSWAFYRDNQPYNPIHRLVTQEKARVWEALRARKKSLADEGMAYLLALYLVTRSMALIDLLRLAVCCLQATRFSKQSPFAFKR